MFLRILSFMVTATSVFAASSAQAETVRINSASTTSWELPNVVDQALNSLRSAPGERHELLLEGRFKPSATIQLRWFTETPLTVTAVADSEAVLDGDALPKGKETVFIAGRNITLKGVHFVNSQGHAVIVGGRSDRYAIKECSFEDCWQSAIHVWNDPHTIVADTKPRGFITSNRISRFNLADAKWANDGITVFDQRVVIAGNTISESPTETNGIRAMGRDLVVEHNRIADVSRDDSGGIYLWGGPHASLFRGNVVRHNYVTGASRGIYLDDGTSGAHVFENVVQDSSVCAVFISGGRDNIIRLNVVDQSPVFVHLDSRCLGWDSRPAFSKQVNESLIRLRKALMDKSSGPLFRERYSELRGLAGNSLTAQVYGCPEGNRVRNNFVRDVKANWELMDFAQEVTTEFGALNELMPPSSVGKSEKLSQLSFQQRFGFLGLGRLADVTDAASPVQKGTAIPEKE
ncbi:right-handed parallel beta-helix repeat-containing protein [Rhodopirellula sp.]|nr:right-handed parallel beta-helix repeat-containing protein [Rhodopirellula sp.]